MLTRFEELAPGTKVRVINTPDIVKQSLSLDVGSALEGIVIEQDPLTFDYIVEVNGMNLRVPAENIEMIAERFALLNILSNNRILGEKEDLGDQQPESPVSTDMFDDEVERLFGAKIKAASETLTTMKKSWQEVRDQQLGKQLTEFIDYALPFLDHLVVLVGLCEEESDLKHAITSFKQWFNMAGEVVGSTQVNAWVEMQLEQLDGL